MHLKFLAKTGLGEAVALAWPCASMCTSAIHAHYMDKLTEDSRRQIEQIHSSWIEFEIAGASHKLMTLCADDIEFWPPNAQPVCGRAEVAAHLAHGTQRIHTIEISACRIRGSNEIAYLTARYKTTFSSGEESAPKQLLGSHLWILQKRKGSWLVTLVSWSVWG